MGRMWVLSFDGGLPDDLGSCFKIFTTSMDPVLRSKNILAIFKISTKCL
jgi:hypothetical protein